MVTYRYFKYRIWLSAFVILLIAMLAAGLYPFDFSPKNRVRWLTNDTGFYFNSNAIAYTDNAVPFHVKKAITLQLLICERRGSKNWGVKEILSVYDGPESPSLLVGQWAGRIFVYSRFEKNHGQPWYKQFRSQARFPRGDDHLVTITVDEEKKAIYMDGQPGQVSQMVLKDGADLMFAGRLLIGNSPWGKNGWQGEIKGIALYDRVLLPDEIKMHARLIKVDIRALANTRGCVALYPLDEGEGTIAQSVVRGASPFFLPGRLTALIPSSVGWPFKDMRLYHFGRSDFLKNIAFFVPFGVLFSVILRKRVALGGAAAVLIVSLVGGLISCIIEGGQLFLPTRSTSMADITGNLLGSVLGMQFASMTGFNRIA